MTREEILKLHELSEEVTVSVLTTLGVLRLVPGEADGESKYESLAECAFRMRDEAVAKDEDRFRSEISEIANITDVKVRWSWDLYAKPIHWIQAALLARLENEK